MRLIYLLFLLLPLYSLEPSLINPDLAPEMPGYEDFVKGRQKFEEKNWKKASYYFSRAIKKSRKPYFICKHYLNKADENCPHSFDPCIDSVYILYTRKHKDQHFTEIVCDDLKFYIQDYMPEIRFAIYRHSHFNLGLIDLEKEKFTKAHWHFRQAIGFGKDYIKMGDLFYRCSNIIDPSWIVLATLTSLIQENNDEAKNLIDLALVTLNFFDDDFFRDEMLRFKSDNDEIRYWTDWKNRGITQESWLTERKVIVHIVASIVKSAQNDMQNAIKDASDAIKIKDYAIKDQIFSGESTNDSILYSNRGLLYLKDEKYEEALADFTKAIELDSLNAENYLNRGMIYLILEEYEKGLQDYNQAIDLNPDNADFYKQRALAHLLNDSLEETTSDFNKAHAIEQKLFNEQNERGLLSFSRGKYKTAIADFSKIIKASPENFIGYQNRGAANHEAGLFNEAIKDFDAAIAIASDNGDLYQMRALSFLASSNSEGRAEEDLLIAAQLKPTDPSIYRTLAATHFSSGEHDKAIDCLNQAISLCPASHYPELYKQLAVVYFDKKDFKNALKCSQKAIELGCRDGSIHVICGLCLFEANKFQEAIESYTQSIQSEGDHSNTYYLRGQAYYCLLKLEEACDDLTKAIQLDPSNPELYKFRGLIYLSLHKELEAYTDFFSALKMNPDQTFDEKKIQEKKEGKVIASAPIFNKTETVETFIKFTGALGLNDPFLYPQHLSLSPKTSIDAWEILEEINKLSLEAFGKGLSAGLLEGGWDFLKELGPFLWNLLFHPIQTSEELIESIKLLMNHALDEEWEKVFEALAPELKELILTWDKIDDYKKGALTGTFIGKNGVAALTAIGSVKSLSKLKSVAIAGKAKFSRKLKRTKPQVVSLPPSELPPPKIPIDNGWHWPYNGGAIIGGRFYTEHALARMVPKRNFQARAILEERAFRKSKELGFSFKSWDEVDAWTKTLGSEGASFSVEPRGIPPSVVEAEIAHPGSTGVKVIINNKGDVLSVYKGGSLII